MNQFGNLIWVRVAGAAKPAADHSFMCRVQTTRLFSTAAHLGFARFQWHGIIIIVIGNVNSKATLWQAIAWAAPTTSSTILAANGEYTILLAR